jgi:hypothetical protein
LAPSQLNATPVLIRIGFADYFRIEKNFYGVKVG